MLGQSMLARRFALAFVMLSAAGCAAEPAAEVDDNDNDDGTDPSAGAAVTARPCVATDSSLFFHGMSGYGRELAQTGLCVPSLGGENGFWSDIAYANAPASKIVGGYSAGRIPLVRRLAKGEGPEQTAVMLDPSWADGPRFEGRTGPDIVDKWLDGDAARRFILVYLPSSAGWREYAALTSRTHAAQIKICPVTGGTHLDLPRIVTAKLFTDPETWIADRCP